MAQPLGKKYNSLLYVDKNGVTQNVLAQSGVADLTMLELERGPKSFIIPMTRGSTLPADGPHWDDWAEYWLSRGMGISLVNRVKATYLNGRDIYGRVNKSVVTISDDPELVAGLSDDGTREIAAIADGIRNGHEIALLAVRNKYPGQTFNVNIGDQMSWDTSDGGKSNEYFRAVLAHMKSMFGADKFLGWTNLNGTGTPTLPQSIFAYVPDRTVICTPFGLFIVPQIIPGACLVVVGTTGMKYEGADSTMRLLATPRVFGLPIDGMMYPGVEPFASNASTYHFRAVQTAYAAQGGLSDIASSVRNVLLQYQERPQLLDIMFGRAVGNFSSSVPPLSSIRKIGKAFVSPQIGRLFANGMLGVDKQFVVGGTPVTYVTLTARNLHLATSTHEIANAMMEVYTDAESLRRAADVKMKPANVVSYCATVVEQIYPFEDTWLHSQMVKGKFNFDTEQFVDGVTWNKAIKQTKENSNPGEFVYFSESTFTEAVYGGDDMEFVNDGEFQMRYSTVPGEYSAPYFVVSGVRISENQARYAAYNYAGSWKTWTSDGGKITDLALAMQHLFRDTEDDGVGGEGASPTDPEEDREIIRGVLAGLEDSGSGTGRGITRQDLAPSKFLKQGVPWAAGLNSDDIARMQIVYKGNQSKAVESIMGTIIMLASDPYRVARLMGAENA